MTKDRIRISAIVFYSSLIFVLVISILNLLPEYRLNISSSYLPQVSQDEEANSGSRGEEADDSNGDLLVWSDELQDWALSPEGTKDGRPVASSNKPKEDDCIWPEDRVKRQCSSEDRIIHQLKLVGGQNQNNLELFKISLASDRSLPNGQELFIKDKCRVNRCLITHDLNEADAIVFPNSDVHVEPSKANRINQIWIGHFLESPPNTFDKRFTRRYRGQHAFNWTASYRSDSDIATPYAKFVPYLVDERAPPSLSASDHADLGKFYTLVSKKHRALIEKKQAKVAWFVSNCHAKNDRLEFAHQLAKFIQVDIYGKCGNLTCNKWTQADCLRMINRDYKFYLALENSNNREYITEKLYQNALGFNDLDHLLVPIVMGPKREDYERLAPPASFIHVDDFESVEDLAIFLKHLSNNDHLLYSYFRWKTMGKFIDTKFWCRLCAMIHMAHQSKRIKVIPSIKDWWLNEI